MKRIISSLVVFVLLIGIVPLSKAAYVKESRLSETSRTSRAIYLELTPATTEVINRVRIIKVNAGSQEEADEQLARGNSTTYYKRWAKPIKIIGLMPGGDYCFKGNFITVKEYKGGRFATNENQEWDPANETGWFCTSSADDITPMNNESQDVVIESHDNDLLVQNIEVNPIIERAYVDDKKTTGHWMNITLHNAGESSVDGQKEVVISCIDKAPTSGLNMVKKVIGKDLVSGESFKLSMFITRKMALNCRSSFEIKLPTDDILFNNTERVMIQSNANGSYFIQKY